MKRNESGRKEIEEERITSKSSLKKGGQRGGFADNNMAAVAGQYTKDVKYISHKESV